MTISEFDAKYLVNKIDSLPTLPTVYYQLLEVMNNPMSTAIEVAEVIAMDQASATKVLKAANSPIYGFYGRIQNITQAITYIGFEEVRNLVTAITIIDFFSSNFEDSILNPIEFWKHSIAVGIITRMIGKQVKAQDLESYFLAGILHDVGKMVFINLVPEMYSSVYKYSIENRVSHREAEDKLLGINHTIIGEILAEKWNLPNSIKTSIRYHEVGLIDSSFSSLVASTHIANISAIMYGFGCNDDIPIPQPAKGVWDKLSLEDDFFTKTDNIITTCYEDTVNLLLKQNS